MTRLADINNLFIATALQELAIIGHKPVATTQIIVMPAWQTMSPLENMTRVVVDTICVDETRSGKLDRAETKVLKRKYRFENGVKYWAVVSTASIVFGRSKPKTMYISTYIPFTSREDACAYAAFPSAGDGVLRITNWFNE